MRKVLDRWPKQIQGLALAVLQIRHRPPNLRTKRHVRRWLETQLDTEEPFQSSTLKWTPKILSGFASSVAEVDLLASIFTDAVLSKAYRFMNSTSPIKRPVSDADLVVLEAEKHRIQRAIWRLHLYTETLHTEGMSWEGDDNIDVQSEGFRYVRAICSRVRKESCAVPMGDIPMAFPYRWHYIGLGYPLWDEVRLQNWGFVEPETNNDFAAKWWALETINEHQGEVRQEKKHLFLDNKKERVAVEKLCKTQHRTE
ncbi:hypothetical protein LTS18_002824 [Coniosporium uncinatum]|uniref:Uncharacterized protein n=1 Tax=Coniosporium uncinatum TaxID=93489 RepID=A0ACC3DU40_9PEZI|nr:hypothetical protein LTS18_002824 [Coniosporium uncinatum]